MFAFLLHCNSTVRSPLQSLLDWLEWLSKYGLIDIIFGIGVFGVLISFFRKIISSNYKHLHVDLAPGNAVHIGDTKIDCSARFQISNSGADNFYIARAYFRPKQRSRWCLLPRCAVQVHSKSIRIANKNAYELKFDNSQEQTLSHYEALVAPNHDKGVITWLALERPLDNELVRHRKCGTLFIEYAARGQQGLHKERL